MINSRDLAALDPQGAVKAWAFLMTCQAQDIDVLVTSTYRENASQDALYAMGRTIPGKRVTNARGGQSFHNFRVAFDIVPLRKGKPVWSTTGEDDDSKGGHHKAALINGSNILPLHPLTKAHDNAATSDNGPDNDDQILF